MEHLNSQQIVEQYKKGRRDFSKIICKSGDLRESDLRGAIFRKADLSGSSLRGSDLSNADFSGATFFWSSLRFCNLRNTKFTGASMIWCCFENAILDNTDFRRAELSHSLFYNCERFKGDFEGANLFKVIWDESDHSAVDLEEQIKTLEAAGISLDRILYVKSKIEERKNRLFGFFDFLKKPKPGYREVSSLYNPDIKKTFETGYGVKKSIYTAISDYVKKLDYSVKNIKTPKQKWKERIGKE